MLSRAKPAWKKILPSRLGWLPARLLPPACPTRLRRENPLAEIQMAPVGMLMAAGGRLLPPCPRIPWELGLQWGLARHGRAGRQDFLEHVARGGRNARHRSVGLTLLAARWWIVTARRPSLQSLSKRDGCHPAPLEPRIGHEERGWRCPHCIPPYSVPPGRGRGEQPNAFQISCKWLGRVIHIKLIKPLLVSRGRNPDVAVYLFWISPFFFFFFPFNIFFQEIFKGTGTPRCVWQQGLAGAGCLRHIWSWSVGAGRGALTS